MNKQQKDFTFKIVFLSNIKKNKRYDYQED